MNQVAFFEIPVLDLKKAESFFAKIFGWTFEQMRGLPDMLLISNLPQGPAGLIFKTTSIPKKPGVIVHVEVGNIDETLKAVKKARGKVLQQKTLIPGQGWYAYFTTPDGCMLAVWQSLLRAA